VHSKQCAGHIRWHVSFLTFSSRLLSGGFYDVMSPCHPAPPLSLGTLANLPKCSSASPPHPLAHTRPLTSPLSVRCDTTAGHLAEAMGPQVHITATNHQCVCEQKKGELCGFGCVGLILCV